MFFWPTIAVGTSVQIKMALTLVTRTEYEAGRVETLPDDRLLSVYEETKDWLNRHMAETGTDNKLDVSGNPYNHERWEIKLHYLERIEEELMRRGLLKFN